MIITSLLTILICQQTWQWYLKAFICCIKKKNICVGDSAQAHCKSLLRISPSAKSRLLCFAPVFIWDAFLAGLALYCTEELREKKKTTPVCGFMSHCLVSSNPSLSLLIASLRCVHSDTSGSIFVSISCWITGATQKTIWHDAVFKTGVSLSVMPFSPACFNLHCSVLPSAWWEA